MKLTTLMLAIMVIGALFLSSCKKDDSNPVSTPTVTHAAGAYVGMIAGGSESGVLSLNISTTSPKSSGNMFVSTVYSVSGTVIIGGTTITLTGTYNNVNDSLHVSGGGYSFNGTYINGVLTGTYSGPHGSGGFSSQSSSGTDSVRVYLGSSASQVAGHGSATLNIVTKGTALVGMAVSSGGSNKTAFFGVISGGTNIALKISDGNVTFNLGQGVIASDFSSANGTYTTAAFNTSDPDHGTWSVVRYK